MFVNAEIFFYDLFCPDELGLGGEADQLRYCQRHTQHNVVVIPRRGFVFNMP